MPPDVGDVKINANNDTILIWDGKQWLTISDKAVKSIPVFQYKCDVGTFRIEEIQNLKEIDKKIDIVKKAVKEFGQRAAEHQDKMILSLLKQRAKEQGQDTEEQRNRERMRRFRDIAIDEYFEEFE